MLLEDTTQPPGESGPLSVTEITRHIRRILEEDIGRVEVEGEISNWTVAASGHAYFALKDAGALLSCVMFRGSRERCAFNPEDGAKVRATGSISVYERRGQYQLIVQRLVEAGVGDLHRRFLELKERLEQEGLFDPEKKRPIPAFPNRVGVVTSPTGAALRDILHVIKRRFPGMHVLLAPTLVQGETAAPAIVRAIENINAYNKTLAAEERIDTLIVGRGGGSIEDLWAFNEESVARAIAASAIPVISAVGHETDFTIADFVADMRAPTPSAAAEVVVDEAAALTEHVADMRERAMRALAHEVEKRRLRLERLKGSWGMRQPIERVRQAMQRLDETQTRAAQALTEKMRTLRHRLDRASDRRDALNPEAVLERGYSIVLRARDARVVSRERQVRVDDHIQIRLAKGELRAVVMPKGEDLFDGVEV